MAQSVYPVPSSGSAPVLNYTNTYTNSTNWTAPNNTYAVKVLCVAGGGGGGGISMSTNSGAGAYAIGTPGAGGQVKEAVVTVTPGSTYTITVGAGGNYGYCSAPSGNTGGTSFVGGGAGGDSQFGNLVYCYGGAGGDTASMNRGTSGRTSRYGSTFSGTYSTATNFNPSGGVSSGYTPPYTYSLIGTFGTQTAQTWSNPNPSYDSSGTIQGPYIQGIGTCLPLVLSATTYAYGYQRQFAAGGYSTAGYGAGAWISDALGSTYSTAGFNGLYNIIQTPQGPGSGGVSAGYPGNYGSASYNGWAGQAGLVRLEYTA